MSFDVTIVGAGPAGIGCALALQRAGIRDILVLEADKIGASFRKWPQQMRLITPSFHGNPFFQTDLNAITPDTSPADFCQQEHLSGEQYADYLFAVVRHFDLPVNQQERLTKLTSSTGGYTVETNKGTYESKTVIWAGGEFSLPKTGNFQGAELCAHSSVFRNWEDYQGQNAVIIGGYESGIDAAYHLVELGKKVLVLSSGEPWEADHPDPSEVISPYTRSRLLQTLRKHTGKLALRGNSEVVSVSKLSGRYVIETADGEVIDSENRPIAATGFHSALTPIKDLFEWEGSVPQFTEEDESTLHEGLYYSGPSLVQRKSKFCFIYKYRARFGVVARAIATRLGHPEPDQEDDKRRGFLIDDLECCTNCECAVDSEAESVESHT